MEKNHLFEQKWASKFRFTTIINFRIGVNALFGWLGAASAPVVCATAYFATGQGGSGG
jgi:hypothetical protein